MFLNPLMLVGLGAAVLPVVLHLLSRSRHQTAPWGAMMFLRADENRRQRASRISHWLLLLNRMAIIALLAIALARPVTRGAWSDAVSSGGLSAVIVLDCSGSTAFEENGISRFEQGRAAARKILESLQPGDSAGLILMGLSDAADEDASENDLPLTADLQLIADAITRAQPGKGIADTPAAMERAADLLDQASTGGGGRDIYLITDRQALSWRSADARFTERWRQRIARMPPTRVWHAPVGSDETQNVVVESFRLLNAPAIRGRAAELEVRVRNRGTVQRAELPLAITQGEKLIHQTTLNLAPETVSRLRVPITFDVAGSFVLTAAVKSSGLTADDTLDTAPVVVEPPKVLVLSGDERTGSFRSEADYLRVALAPFAAATTQPNDAAPIGNVSAVEVVAAENWVDQRLSDYQVVVLANVDLFLPQQVQAIEQYVYDGGGLFVTLGNLTRVEDYNELLYRGGAGVLPAELYSQTPADGSGATSVIGAELTPGAEPHPVFAFLRGRPGLLSSITVGRYFPAWPRASEARALASYASGFPFLVEGSFGRGRVLLLTTTIDTDWTTLPLSNFYLPFVQSLVRYLSLSAIPQHVLAPGQPIRLTLPENGPSQRSGTLLDPRGVTVNLRLVRIGSREEIRYDNTQFPGRYAITVTEAGRPRTEHFVVRPSRDESDLSRLPDARWASIQNDLSLRIAETSRTTIDSQIEQDRAGGEWWGAALAAVVVLVLLELFVGRFAARQE